MLAAFSLVVATLSFSLRPDAFFVGDPGVKLISARNALHSPASPLSIPLPHIGADATPHVESFFAIHGDHSHAITSEAFPLLTAPLLAAFGLRGLFVLPAVSFIATLAACAWLSVVLDARREPAVVATLAGLGTPFLFYGLEFWEHMPALALATCGAALLLDAARRSPGRHSSAGASLAAGLLMGAAVVLRLEAACFVVAVAFASRTLVHRPTWRSLAVTALGAAAAMLPLELYTLAHFGSVVPGHLGANAALVGGGWWSQRVDLAAAWFLPSRWTLAGPVRAESLWSVAPAAVIGALSFLATPERAERMFLWIVWLLTTALVWLGAPNDGGGQWGPRYLLFSYVPLVLLATDALRPRRRRAATLALVVALVAGCLWVQRAAYRQLRGAKVVYGQVVDFVEGVANPGAPVVTDLWWLDQIAAAALDGRTLLFAGDAGTGRDIVQRLSDVTAPVVTVIRSREQSADADGWTGSSCYFEESRAELAVRGLVAIRLRHLCGHRP